MADRQAAPREATLSDDGGLTLIEAIISMAIFAIFVAILMTSTVSLTRAASRAEIVARSANSVLTVFQNLDRDVRYADAINFPGLGASGAEYVEFRVPRRNTTTNPTCTQWRFNSNTGLLQMRRWDDLGSNSSPTAWSTQLTRVVNDPAPGYPFAMVPAKLGGSTMQQLTLTVSAGTLDPTFGAEVSTGFVARNSSIQSPSNSDAAAAGKSDTPVCTFSGSRP